LDTALAGEGAREQAMAGLWRLVMPATIFVAALLLFAIEPLIAKMILPWFGGSAAVWMACLLFFQTALLCGYLYAHLLATRVPPRWQWRIHVMLLVISLVFLPAIPAAHWRPAASGNPLLLILGLLAAPAGAASRLTTRPLHALALSAGIAVASVWIGLAASYAVPQLTPSFAILAVVTAAYLGAMAASRPRRRYAAPNA